MSLNLEEESTITSTERLYCPIEDCPKHTEGYATQSGLTRHMNSVHPDYVQS